MDILNRLPMWLLDDIETVILKIGGPEMKHRPSNHASRAFFATVVCAGLKLTGDLSAVEPAPTRQEAYDGTPIENSVPPQSVAPLRKKNATPPKVLRYAKHLLNRYDHNRDGILQSYEWNAMQGHPQRIDQDGDQEVTLAELAHWIAEYSQRKRSGGSFERESIPAIAESSPVADQPSVVTELSAADVSAEVDPHVLNQEEPVGKHRERKFHVADKRLPAGLPDWFLDRDKDGDGQLTVSEFTTTGGAQELADFKRLDANGDGLVTAKECVKKSSDKPSTAKAASDVLPAQSPEKTARGRRKPRATQQQ